MGRAPCCEKMGLKKGPWTQEEDQILINYIRHYGHTNWRALPKQAGLLRCGKSCRLRWINYLRPDIKRGNFTIEEEETIIKLHQILGNRWSAIAAKLPGRTDNEIKNVWHTHLKKRLNKPNNNPKDQETLIKKEAREESAQEIIASSPQQPSGSIEIVTEKINNGDRDLKDNGIKTEYFRLSNDSIVTEESFWPEVISDDQLYGPSLMFPLGSKVGNNNMSSSESSLNVLDDHELEFWHGMFSGNGELLGMPEM